MDESEYMVVIHPVRRTNVDSQSGRRVLDLLTSSLIVRQGGGRQLLILKINGLPGYSGSMLI